MNIWIKYGPLAYTFFTRIFLNGKWFLSNLLNYVWSNIGLRAMPIFILYFTVELTVYKVILSLLLYIYLYCLFLIFYEIWYLHNDFVAKKEKNWAKHITEHLPCKFFLKQTIVRMIIWIIWLISLYFINTKILTWFWIIIIITAIVFCIHNCIRNYYYNFFTFFALRFLKFVIFVLPIYFLINSYNNVIIDETIVVFLLYQYYLNIDAYDSKLWWKHILPHNLLYYWYLTISMWVLFFYTNSELYLCYLLIFLIFYIIRRPKNISEFNR